MICKGTSRNPEKGSAVISGAFLSYSQIILLLYEKPGVPLTDVMLSLKGRSFRLESCSAILVYGILMMLGVILLAERQNRHYFEAVSGAFEW